jgi:hypothetical protein
MDPLNQIVNLMDPNQLFSNIAQIDHHFIRDVFKNFIQIESNDPLDGIIELQNLSRKANSIMNPLLQALLITTIRKVQSNLSKTLLFFPLENNNHGVFTEFTKCDSHYLCELEERPLELKIEWYYDSSLEKINDRFIISPSQCYCLEIYDLGSQNMITVLTDWYAITKHGYEYSITYPAFKLIEQADPNIRAIKSEMVKKSQNENPSINVINYYELIESYMDSGYINDMDNLNLIMSSVVEVGDTFILELIMASYFDVLNYIISRNPFFRDDIINRLYLTPIRHYNFEILKILMNLDNNPPYHTMFYEAVRIGK